MIDTAAFLPKLERSNVLWRGAFDPFRPQLVEDLKKLVEAGKAQGSELEESIQHRVLWARNVYAEEALRAGEHELRLSVLSARVVCGNEVCLECEVRIERADGSAGFTISSRLVRGRGENEFGEPSYRVPVHIRQVLLPDGTRHARVPQANLVKLIESHGAAPARGKASRALMRD